MRIPKQSFFYNEHLMIHLDVFMKNKIKIDNSEISQQVFEFFLN